MTEDAKCAFPWSNAMQAFSWLTITGTRIGNWGKTECRRFMCWNREAVSQSKNAGFA